MKIEKFKLIKNKQRPDWCYKYELTNVDQRFVIFTMDGGESFHAYIEERVWHKPNTFYTVKEDMFKSIDECIGFFTTNTVA